MTGAVLKFARTIRLDASDGFSFAVPAKPGEWAVSGAFAFADVEPDALKGKDRLAFAQGFLGLESLGRSTFVAVSTISETEMTQNVERLARHFVERYGAPDLDAARPVAADEVGFMQDLCADHPPGRLLAVERDFGPDGIVERFRAVSPPDPMSHSKIWDIVAEE